MSIFRPMLTTWLLRVSYVATLERTLAERTPGHERYIATTSALIPRLPRQPRNPDGPSDREM